MASNDSKADTLYRILLKEQAGGFRDTAVIGGLDRFLQRWGDQLRPILGDLRSYSVLTPPQRQAWADAALPLLAARAQPQADTRPTDPAFPGPSQTGLSPARRGTAKPPGRKLSLDDDVARLRGVSSQIRPRLQRLGVEKVKDLVYLFPRRHNDFAHIRKVSELEPGQDQTVVVVVWESTLTGTGPNRKSTQTIMGDDSGNVRAIWFNNPYLARTLRSGVRVVISGTVSVFRGQFVFESPEYELLLGQDQLLHTGRLVPVYPSTDRLPQRTLRRIVKQALDASIHEVTEFLSDELRHRTGLMGLGDAIAQAHYPDSLPDWKSARRRLAFDELLLLQLAVLARKREWQEEGQGIPLAVDLPRLNAFLELLPFSLTAAQSRALREILEDLGRDRPMSRLLQGDVGSGKTVVAAAALMVAAFNGYQGALMAPTEILAEQHFLTFSHMLSGRVINVGEEHLLTVQAHPTLRPVTVGLLLGSLPSRAKEELRQRVAGGEVDLVIGTHALIEATVEIPKLALAVVDEQHRFGVMQRASLRQKGQRPHLLAMSATPIPRSLALTLYGDLDMSLIDELPPGRQPIRTRWVEPGRREAAYNFVRKEVQAGRQAFIVCPLIEESEAIQSRAATEEHQRLSTQVFPDLRLGLLHGRMALREKEEVMGRFQGGELDILVSTPVVEVGIDVSNATVMLIDGADRFGLAQLHQFRGRVGRGRHQSYCLLVADSPGEEARERLRLVERVHDGFQLAEEDLRLRGPGDYLGTRQSGLAMLRVARLTDQDILSLARREATRLLDSDPDLSQQDHARLREELGLYSQGLAGEMS